VKKELLIIICFLISISCFSQNKESLLRDGNKLYKDSSYNAAEIKYRKSLEKDQDYFNASFNLADAIYKQERYGGPDGSSALFNALKDNAPSREDLSNIYHNLGNSLLKEQKTDKAIEAYKEALKINPNDNDTRYNLTLAKKLKQEQDKQEENKQEEDKQEENKQEENKQEENKQEENKQEEDKQEEDKQEEKKEGISKEDAEKMLEAIEQKEKEIQKELQKTRIKGKKINKLNDW